MSYAEADLEAIRTGKLNTLFHARLAGADLTGRNWPMLIYLRPIWLGHRFLAQIYSKQSCGRLTVGAQ